MSQTLTGIEVSDKYTVVLLAERSWPAVFDTLSLLSIIDPVTFESAGPTKPTGTGPFTFAEYVQGDHFTLKKNPNYWQTGKPYLDGIEIKIFSDPQSMMTQFEAGAIDLVLAPPIRDVARLSKDPRYVITFHEYSGGANLVFVQAKDGAGPTTNKLFRQALNAAIDRKRWTDAVLLGYGKPKTLPLAPPNPGYDSARDQAVSFDLDKAKSLLQQSGVGTPPLEVIWNATAVDNATVMQIYQQDLAKIGLTLTLKPTEPVAFVDQTYNSKFPNLAAGATLYGNLRPGFFAGNVYYSPFNNWSSFRSDRLRQLTDGLLHETDATKQKQIYADWMDYIQDESWAMPWSNTAPRFASFRQSPWSALEPGRLHDDQRRLAVRMTPVTRRSALQLLALGGAAALAAACSGIAPASPPTQAPAVASSSQPKHGGTLRVGVLGDLAWPGRAPHHWPGLTSSRLGRGQHPRRQAQHGAGPRRVAGSGDRCAADDRQAAQWHPVPYRPRVDEPGPRVELHAVEGSKGQSDVCKPRQALRGPGDARQVARCACNSTSRIRSWSMPCRTCRSSIPCRSSSRVSRSLSELVRSRL